MADFSAQLGHVIAVTLLTELAKATEILTDLRCCNIHFSAKGAGGDAHHTLVMQVIQITVVAGETVDDCIRDFLFFHT